MPQYTITDPTSGRKVTLTGDSPPTEAELNEIFAKLPGAKPSALTDPNRKPAAAEDFLPPKPTIGDHVSNFLTHAATMADPRPLLHLVYDAAQATPGGMLSGGDPRALLEDLKGMGKAQLDLIRKGIAEAKAGRVSEGAGHAAAGALPVVGPMAAGIGDTLGSGDISGAAGDVAGLYLGGKVIPKVAERIAPKAIPVVPAAKTAAPMAEAVRFVESRGIPVDAATASGRPIVASIQKKVSDSMGGAGIAERFKAEQSAALARTGKELADTAHPIPVTPEQAGTAAQQGVRDVVHAENTKATGAYDRLRQIEDDPAHTQTIYPERPVPKDNAKPFAIRQDASLEDVFLGAWRDAKNQGYKGSIGELWAEFADKVWEAKSLRAETADSAGEYSHDAFLKAIREYGGLKPFEKDYTPGAPAQKLTGDYENLTQLFANQKGANAIMRAGGKELDELLGHLQEDPRWSHVVDGRHTSDLKDMLEEIGTAKKHGTGSAGPTSDIQHYLRGVGVEPGVPWWEAPKQPVDLQAPVDLRDVKARLKPVADRLLREGEIAPLMGEKATAARALDRLVNGPDHAPLSVVDAALGELKTFARADNPDLRTIGQGVVADAVKQLHGAVDATAAQLGPEAVAALNEGRTATKAKYVAADVLKGLERGQGEPVAAYRRLTAPGDSAVSQLRDLAKQAPAALPQVGRAVLDGLLDTATKDGGFDKARTIRTAWNKIGPETKSLLYKDPGYVKDVDNFLRVAEKIAENPNPSGTARINNLFNATSAAVGYPVAKLLYSRAGVRLLSEGYRIPMSSPAAVAKYTAKLTTALKAQAALEPAMAADTQTDRERARAAR